MNDFNAVYQSMSISMCNNCRNLHTKSFTYVENRHKWIVLLRLKDLYVYASKY